MGTGMRLGSRIYTNSFAGKNNEAYKPFYLRDLGNSFYGLSKAQYSYSTYYQLADIGAGSGARGDRWTRSQGYPPTSFIPPALIR
jgi:hypothetical protein